MRAFWRNYNLSCVLFVLFMTSWLLQGVAQWFEVANEARAHGEASVLDALVPAFLSATLENWQSEFVQLLTFVVLTSFLIHKGSHESKDSDDEVKAMLGRIEERLKRLERGEAWPRVTNGRHANGDGDAARADAGHTGNGHTGHGRTGHGRTGAAFGPGGHGGDLPAEHGHGGHDAGRRPAGVAYSAPVKP